MSDGPHLAPRTCPVCTEDLVLTRLSCPSCSTELSGSFERCEYCTLERGDREMLRVFLASRGNMRELERHLGVSYPTARARFDEMLSRLGLGRAPSQSTKVDVLERLARGEVDVDEALAHLEDPTR